MCSFVGFGYGNHDDASFLLTEKITLKNGENTLDILSLMVGLQVYKNGHNIKSSLLANFIEATRMNFYMVLFLVMFPELRAVV